MKKINIAELLKDCPTGMELDCTMYEDVTLIHILEGNAYPIKIKTPEGQVSLNKYGQYSDSELAKCVIFPKGKTTWEGFVPPYKFKDGDIITNKSDGSICIFKKEGYEIGTVAYYCGVDSFDNFYINDLSYDPANYDSEEDFGYIKDFRLATEEEKEKLFKAIKDNDCKWNPDMKTLEDLIESNKEENMEERIWKTEFIEYLEMLGRATDIDGNKIIPPEDYLIGNITKEDNGMLVKFVKKKPQYPTTYDECCKVLDIYPHNELCIESSDGYVSDLEKEIYNKISALNKLIICRDAYWKIAGEQMGLKTPWKPDLENKDLYCLYNYCGQIIKSMTTAAFNKILIFPTEEMRDIFYKNFKDLIESCKELL